MTDRERFVRWMHFQSVDRPPWWEPGYWKETLDRWADEGMPQDVHLVDFFGIDRREGLGIQTGMMPGFREETIEDTGEYRIYRDGGGVVRKEFKGEKSRRSMPQFLRHPVESRGDFKRIQDALNPHSPARYPLYWEDKKRDWKDRTFPLHLHVSSLFGAIRNWMGLERVGLTLYDDPGFIEDMMEYLTWFILTLIKRAVEEVDIDYASFWEDMAFKTGPLISPDHFQKLMVPRYKRITGYLREHGIDIILVDSDGDISRLIPLWLEGGVNWVTPVERAAGMDAHALRRQYGTRLLMMGGIDKRAPARGREAIDAELAQVADLFADGGFIVQCDHWVPPDVSFANYVYFVKRAKEIALRKAEGTRRG